MTFTSKIPSSSVKTQVSVATNALKVDADTPSAASAPAHAVVDQDSTRFEGTARSSAERPSLASNIGNTNKPSAMLAIRAGASAAIEPQKTMRFAKYDGPEVSFPLGEEDAAALKTTNAVSPFLTTSPRVLVQPAGLAPPTHPGDDGYFDELEKVVDLQLARREGGNVEQLLGDRVPRLFAGYSLEEAAKAVHTDLPSDWPTALLKQLLGDGAKFDPAVVPHLSQSDFVNTVVTTSGVLGMATAAVSPSAFACKWHEGRARPEEAIWAIHRGELEGAPESLKEKIASLELGKPEEATAYPEGSPRHPSWPAMHSAASISSMVLAVLLDLDKEQLEETRNLDYAVATFRTVAGVHFETDNLAGLKIGQQAIEAWLPDFLAQCAGANPDDVRAKIEKIRYDWDKHPVL